MGLRCRSDQQLWTLTASGKETFQIINVNSGLCASDQGASTASGAAVIQETCTHNSNKQWGFRPIDGTSTGTTTPASASPSASAPAATSAPATTAAPDGTGRYRCRRRSTPGRRTVPSGSPSPSSRHLPGDRDGAGEQAEPNAEGHLRLRRRRRDRQQPLCDVTARITIHHNWIRGTNQRKPSTDNVAYTHLYRNYLQDITSYGDYAHGGTKMVLENSY